MSSAIAAFVGNVPMQNFSEGDLIFREQEPADGRMYALMEGQVHIARQGHLLETVSTEGALFGELALIDSMPRSATAQAASPVRLAVITSEKFRELILRNPSFALEVMRLLTSRVRANLY